VTRASRGRVIRLGVAAAILLIGGGYAVNTLMTDDTATAGSATDGDTASTPDAGTHGQHGQHGHGHAVLGDGRSLTAGGYRMAGLRLEDGRLSFKLMDDLTGAPVTEYEVVHEKQLHMFVFGTDLSDFRHVHPEQRGDRWTLDLDGLRPGEHRVVAEFTPQGEESAVMLGGAADVPGDAEPQPLPPPDTTAQVDGYTVAVRAALGQSAEIEVTVRRDSGEAVALAPYLGSWSHGALVHAGPLDVRHLHPNEEYSPGGPSPERLTFAVPPGLSGDYRLIVEFATDTGVHQAEFTLSSA
jgi:hypothetical protein